MSKEQPDPQTLEMFDIWTALKPKEKEQFIRQIREEVPGAEAIANAFEREYRASQARA